MTSVDVSQKSPTTMTRSRSIAIATGPRGRIREAVNEHARVSFRYDDMGLPVEARCDEHLIKRSYDKHGLIRSLQSSLGAQLSYERMSMVSLFVSKQTKQRRMHASQVSTGMIV